MYFIYQPFIIICPIIIYPTIIYPTIICPLIISSWQSLILQLSVLDNHFSFNYQSYNQLFFIYQSFTITCPLIISPTINYPVFISPLKSFIFQFSVLSNHVSLNYKSYNNLFCSLTVFSFFHSTFVKYLNFSNNVNNNIFYNYFSYRLYIIWSG